jgi:hypothetical protein
MRPSDRVTVFSFLYDLEVQWRWQAIGTGRLLSFKMPPTKPYSAVYESIGTADRRFDNEKGRKGVIMLTDGQDSVLFNRTKQLGGVLDIEKDSDFQKYLQKIRKRNIPVYFVALLPDLRAEYAELNSPAYRTSSEYL